jgi:hypothetical protein
MRLGAEGAIPVIWARHLHREPAGVFLTNGDIATTHQLSRRAPPLYSCFGSNPSSRHFRRSGMTAGYTMRYLGGSTTALVDPSGAGCMPGGLSPCGLSAGAPPDFVSDGRDEPCGCNRPLSSGGERPVVVLTSLFGSVCAAANPHDKVRQIAIIRSRMANLRFACERQTSSAGFSSLAATSGTLRPQHVRSWRAPCKGGAFQWVQVPPGNRSSRKQSEQSWR